MTVEPTAVSLGRHRRAEAGAVAVLLAASTGVFVSHGLHGVLERDLAIYTYAGQRVADGLPPYVGIVNRAGPLSHLVPGLGIWVGRQLDVSAVLSARVLFLLISVVAVYAAYRLGRTLLGSTGLGVAVASSLVAVHGFVDYASRGPREKTLMVLLVLVFMEAVVRRRWLPAGVALGLATLTWQPVFLAGLAVGVVGVVLEERGRRVRGLVRFAGGGLLPLAGFVGYYVAVGRLQEFVDCFALINLRYTQAYSVFHNLPRNGERLVHGFGVSLWVLGLGVLASLVGGAVAAVRLARDRSAGGADRVAFSAGTVVALVWTVRSFNNWPDALVLLPFAVAGIAVLLGAVRAAGGRRVATVAAVVTVVVAFADGARYAVGSRENGYQAQAHRAERVMAVLGPDASLLSIQAPAPLVVTGDVNPIRHQMFSLGLGRYVEDTWPGGIDGLRAELLDRRPTVVVAEGKFRPLWVTELLEDYVRVGYDRDGNYGWFVSDEVPPQQRNAARRVVKGTAG